MVCPKCKREVSNEADFCPYCGAKVEKKTGGEKKKFRIIGISVIVLLIGATCFGIFIVKNKEDDRNTATVSGKGAVSLKDETTGKEKKSEKPQIIVEHILNAVAHKENLAFVLFDTGEKQYKGYVDQEGKMKFYMPIDQGASSDDVYKYTVSFENGYVWFEYSGTFYVMDASGNITSEYNADKVICYGAGYTWTLSEEDKSWDNAGVHKYVMHDPNGNEVLSYSIDNENWDNDYTVYYMGQGVFAYEMLKIDEETEMPEKKGMIYDTTVSKQLDPEMDINKVINAQIYDGMITIMDTADGYYPGEDNPIILTLIKDGEIQKKTISGGDIDGAEDYPKLLGWTDKYVLFSIEIDHRTQIWVCNLEQDKAMKYEGEYKDYVTDYDSPGSNISGDVFAVQIAGADGKEYVSLINAETMEDLTELIPTENFISFFLMNGIFEVDMGEYSKIYDVQGKELLTVSEEQLIRDIGEDEIVIMNKDNDEKKIVWEHSDGTKMFDQIDTTKSKEMVKAEVEQ